MCFGCRQVSAKPGKGKTGRKDVKRKQPEPLEAEADVSAPCPQCEECTKPAELRHWQAAWAKFLGIASDFDRACKR